MQYRIEGGSLPALIINLNPGETIVSEVGGRTGPVALSLPKPREAAPVRPLAVCSPVRACL